MPKAYWIGAYGPIRHPERHAQAARLAADAVAANGGRFIARGDPVKVYERGQQHRVVLVEFPSVAAAVATYESAAYQQAVAILGEDATRDIRIVEGV